MAEGSEPNNVVSQLLSRIEELSDAISARPNQVETEVRRVFTGNGNVEKVKARVKAQTHRLAHLAAQTNLVNLVV